MTRGSRLFPLVDSRERTTSNSTGLSDTSKPFLEILGNMSVGYDDDTTLTSTPVTWSNKVIW
jgi:hypothetical protein